MTARLVLALGVALAMAAPAAAQDFQPKEKGLLMLNARVSGVLTDAEDPILTSGGAASGLNAKVGDDVMPTLGLTYFLTDHLAVEAIAGNSTHAKRCSSRHYYKNPIFSALHCHV